AGGVESADAVLAVLDGPSVDDGTACEIGLFYGLKQRDPARKGVVGLLTDLRAERRGDFAINLFVRGCIEASGGVVVDSLAEALAPLQRWRAEYPPPTTSRSVRRLHRRGSGKTSDRAGRDSPTWPSREGFDAIRIEPRHDENHLRALLSADGVSCAGRSV